MLRQFIAARARSATLEQVVSQESNMAAESRFGNRQIRRRDLILSRLNDLLRLPSLGNRCDKEEAFPDFHHSSIVDH